MTAIIAIGILILIQQILKDYALKGKGQSSAEAKSTPPVVRRKESSYPWAVLGIEPTASKMEIKKAYRRKIKECHPDITGMDSHQQTIEINEAYKEALRNV